MALVARMRGGLGEIIELEEAQRLINAYALIHQVYTVLFDADGKIVLASPQPASRLCTLVQVTDIGKGLCSACLSIIGEQAFVLGDGYIHSCPSGLVLWGAPLVHSGDYVGGIVAGQVRMWPIDAMARKEIVDLAKTCGIESSLFLGAADEVYVKATKEVQAASDILFALATYISVGTTMPLSYQRKVSFQQARLAETIIERKRSANCLGHGNHAGIYPLDKERELLTRVRLGDRSGAKEILNQILGDILFDSAGKSEILKARLLELSAVLSRAAVESGGSLQRLLGLNFTYVQELAEIEPLEEICAWIVKVLEAFMDEVYATRRFSNQPAMGKAVSYIQEHFREELTLEDVARAVHFSPYYLSRLFREELGMNFVDYVTEVRIDEAKRLLLGTSKTVSEIASLVGYQDPSYFTKVFKKVEGRTPTEFRP